jgi:hypothetical protein
MRPFTGHKRRVTAALLSKQPENQNGATVMDQTSSFSSDLSVALDQAFASRTITTKQIELYHHAILWIPFETGRRKL